MSYIFLLIYFCLLLLILIRVAKVKIHSPSVIFIFGYALSIIMSMIGLLSWNTEPELSAKTMLLIATPALCFAVGDLISQLLTIKLRKEGAYSRKTKRYIIGRKIYVKKQFIIISVVLAILTAMCIVNDLNSICEAHSCQAKSFSDVIYYYRINSSLFSANSESFSFLTSQLLKICNINTIVFMYIVIRNMLNREEFKPNIPLLIPIVLGFVNSLLTSGRGIAMTYVVAGIIITLVISGLNNSLLDKEYMKSLIKKLSIIISGTLVAFYLVAPLIGRATESSFVDYTSFYFGCPTPSLNIAVRNKIKPEINQIGENTFYGPYSALDKIGFRTFEKEKTLPFTTISGFYSNVYTSAYRSYSEYGFGVMAILHILAGFIFGELHYFVMRKKDFRILITYALLSANILDMFRDETFYVNTLTTVTIANIITAILICWAVTYGKKNRAAERN